MSDLRDYLEATAPWPQWHDDIDDVRPGAADALRKYYAAVGCSGAAISADLVSDRSETWLLRWRMNLSHYVHAHDVVLLLECLQAVDPALADKAATSIVSAAEDGGTYGESLFCTAVALGLDAELISDRSREALAAVEPAVTITWDGSGESGGAIAAALPGHEVRERFPAPLNVLPLAVGELEIRRDFKVVGRVVPLGRIRVEGDSFAILPPEEAT